MINNKLNGILSNYECLFNIVSNSPPPILHFVRLKQCQNYNAIVFTKLLNKCQFKIQKSQLYINHNHRNNILQSDFQTIQHCHFIPRMFQLIYSIGFCKCTIWKETASYNRTNMSIATSLVFSNT